MPFFIPYLIFDPKNFMSKVVSSGLAFNPENVMRISYHDSYPVNIVTPFVAIKELFGLSGFFEDILLFSAYFHFHYSYFLRLKTLFLI